MGNRGKAWYGWAQEAGVEVVGVVDMNRELLDERCQELGVPDSMRFERIGEAAEATGAQVATVCCANPAHARCLHECLDAGLSAIVEKPMVETLEDAKTVIQKASDKGLRVAVSQNYRFNTGTLTLRDAVQKGEVGEIVSASVTFYRWRPSKGLHLPLVLNQSIHHFDAMRFILGSDPEWCSAKYFNPEWNDCDGPTVIEAVYGFVDGAVVTYSGSYVAQGSVTPYSGLWRVQGSTGQLEFSGDGDGSAVVLTRRDPEEHRQLPPVTSPLTGPAQACRDFLDAVRDDRPPPTDASDNIKSLAMCWAPDISSREGRLVRMDELI